MIKLPCYASIPHLEEGIFEFKWLSAEDAFGTWLKIYYDLVIIFSGRISFLSLEDERKFKSFFNAKTPPIDPQDEYSVLGVEAQDNKIFQIPNNPTQSVAAINQIFAQQKVRVAIIFSQIDIHLSKSAGDPTLIGLIKGMVNNAPDSPHFVLFLTDNPGELHPSLQSSLGRQIKVIDWGYPSKEELTTVYLCLSIIYPKVFEGISPDDLADATQGLLYPEIRGILAKYIDGTEILSMEKMIKEKSEIEKSKAKGGGMVMRKKPNVKFDEVAGLENVKKLIMERVILPLKNPDLAKLYGIKGSTGLLLYGPPGTGKTLIAKAIATELDAVLFDVKPSELLDKWVGETEKKIKKLFSDVRSCKTSVVFFDEIESLTPKRDTSDSSFRLSMVSELLSQFDGIDTARDNITLFIGMTNKPWLIDEAFTRPGRLGTKILVSLPNLAAREAVLKIHLKNRPVADDFDFSSLVSILNGYSGADIKNICDAAAQGHFQGAVKQGKTTLITTQSVRNVIQIIKPSVTSESVQEYIQWAKEKGWLNSEDT
ncbi:MAG: ATP-binding protein [Candidatus Paceibacterota bacterium]